MKSHEIPIFLGEMPLFSRRQRCASTCSIAKVTNSSSTLLGKRLFTWENHRIDSITQ
jgi:hypothetical protein